MKIKHAFTSEVADGGDATLVRPSNWNAEHALDGVAPQRQTVLIGQTDANGYAQFLGFSSGPIVALWGGTSPLRIAFAAGFDGSGAVDYIGSITTDDSGAWVNLPYNSTIFLYIDRNPHGALICGYSTLVPIYAYSAPGSPATDQHWFDIPSMKMRRYTGTVWEEKQRVFVGECVTNASDVTSVTSYAMRGFYDSEWFDASGAFTIYNKSSKIGVDAGLQRVQLLYRESSSYVPVRIHGHWAYTPYEYGANISVVSPVTTRIMSSGNYLCPHYSQQFGSSSSNQMTTGQYRILVERGF
ncbi:MAG: hypothetical protein Q8J64_08755 [Thermodesulfovibrionales bacterium]|nr:hypothetical protein [Thermodesulfovibrionales bacterium]